ncbi:unnamed protein product, partial [Vitis vinifera]
MLTGLTFDQFDLMGNIFNSLPCFVFDVSPFLSLMENLYGNPSFSLLLFLSLHLLVVSSLYQRFSPVDNYLINCGSSDEVSVDGNNRKFMGDSVKSDSVLMCGTRTISIRDSNPDLGLSPIYHTARVFTKPSKYEFEIRDKGTHAVRIHFHQLNSAKYDVSDALFHVSVNGFLVLSNFTDRNLLVYRVNVGGPKVTPFNDSLWRTWVPDEEFLKFSEGSSRVYTSGRIRYQMGGASREVCPDNVYNSARVISSSNATVPNHNITWGFDVVEGYKYLVRMHFCDIASIAIGLIYFNVHVDGHLVYKDMDLSYITNEVLSSPFYADFVVDGDSSGVLTVSVGPSSKSFPYAVDGILNGVEIMKLNNSMGSLDGEVSVEQVLKNWPRGNIGVSVALFASVCLLLTASLLMHRRRVGVKDSVAWSPLPMDISKGNLKSNNQFSCGKSAVFFFLNTLYYVGCINTMWFNPKICFPIFSCSLCIDVLLGDSATVRK